MSMELFWKDLFEYLGNQEHKGAKNEKYEFSIDDSGEISAQRFVKSAPDSSVMNHKTWEKRLPEISNLDMSENGFHIFLNQFYKFSEGKPEVPKDYLKNLRKNRLMEMLNNSFSHIYAKVKDFELACKNLRIPKSQELTKENYDQHFLEFNNSLLSNNFNDSDMLNYFYWHLLMEKIKIPTKSSLLTFSVTIDHQNVTCQGFWKGVLHPFRLADIPAHHCDELFIAIQDALAKHPNHAHLIFETLRKANNPNIAIRIAITPSASEPSTHTSSPDAFYSDTNPPFYVPRIEKAAPDSLSTSPAGSLLGATPTPFYSHLSGNSHASSSSSNAAAAPVGSGSAAHPPTPPSPTQFSESSMASSSSSTVTLTASSSGSNAALTAAPGDSGSEAQADQTGADLANPPPKVLTGESAGRSWSVPSLFWNCWPSSVFERLPKQIQAESTPKISSTVICYTKYPSKNTSYSPILWAVAANFILFCALAETDHCTRILSEMWKDIISFLDPNANLHAFNREESEPFSDEFKDYSAGASTGLCVGFLNAGAGIGLAGYKGYQAWKGQRS